MSPLDKKPSEVDIFNEVISRFTEKLPNFAESIYRKTEPHSDIFKFAWLKINPKDSNPKNTYNFFVLGSRDIGPVAARHIHLSDHAVYLIGKEISKKYNNKISVNIEFDIEGGLLEQKFRKFEKYSFLIWHLGKTIYK